LAPQRTPIPLFIPDPNFLPERITYIDGFGAKLSDLADIDPEIIDSDDDSAGWVDTDSPSHNGSVEKSLVGGLKSWFSFFGSSPTPPAPTSKSSPSPSSLSDVPEQGRAKRTASSRLRREDQGDRWF
jgi:hypothetical protein